MCSTKIAWLFLTLALPLDAATFNVRDYGAVGDGKALNTTAIQKAVDTAAAAGGGIVLVPAGKFLTGPFTLASGINLELAKDAVILISDDRANYPVLRARYVDAITAQDAHDIKITGEGTIDGQGESWWNAFRDDPTMTHRPYLIKFTNCQRVEVGGVTLENSPMFHLAPQNCTDVNIHDVTIHSPANAPNTDGIDPSGWNFLITRCHIDTGDDNIAIKPTRERTPGNKNFLIADCQFVHGHGMSIGGGSSGGLDGLTVSNCAFADTDAGIRIKTPRGNGGLVQNAIYENLTMDSVKRPIYIIDWYPERNAPKDPATEKTEALTRTTPLIRHIVIRNVTATKCPMAGVIRGLPEAPITDLLLTNVHISAQTGLLLYYATDVKFVNSSIHAAEGRDVTTFQAQVEGLGDSKSR
ncbi:MAG TPA: glycosyl hydrolase family 28 protein [Verrucomicrobiae bacterium]